MEIEPNLINLRYYRVLRAINESFHIEEELPLTKLYLEIWWIGQSHKRSEAEALFSGSISFD